MQGQTSKLPVNQANKPVNLVPLQGDLYTSVDKLQPPAA